MTNPRLSGTHKTINVSLPTALWMRARRAVIAYNVTGGVSQLVREGMEVRLAQLDARSVDFDNAFRMEHGRWAEWAERLACYGGQVVAEAPVPNTADFTLAELRQHFEAGTWNSRTAQLVYAQRQLWRARGLKTYQQPLLPPGWDEVVRAHEAPREIVEGKLAPDHYEGVPPGEHPDDIV